MTLHCTLLPAPLSRASHRSQEEASLGCSKQTARSDDEQMGSGLGGTAGTIETCIKGTTGITWAGAGTWQQCRKELWKAVRIVRRGRERKRVWAVGVEASLHLAAARHLKQARFVAMYIRQSSGKSSCCSCRGSEQIREISNSTNSSRSCCYGACNSLTVLNSLMMALQAVISPLPTPGPQYLLLKQLKTSPCALRTFFFLRLQ